jgi:elongation factor P
MLATDLKTGVIYKENGAPFVVLKYEHVKTARSGATVKVKARNLLTGQVLPKSYIGSSRVDDADVRRQNVQYLYKDGNNYVFMDPDTYEQLPMNEDIVGDGVKFLKEGDKVQVMYFEDSPVSIQIPTTVTFEIIYTEPGFKGNTVTNAYKDATIENGTVIKVPPFIKIGDVVKINTETEEYVSKA